jgi:hypothetical protein
MCPDDGLPAQVCPQCVQKVISSYEFKLLCERSDTKLRGCIRNSINVHTFQLLGVSCVNSSMLRLLPEQGYSIVIVYTYHRILDIFTFTKINCSK